MLWDLKNNYESFGIFRGHSKYIRAIKLWKNKLISSSKDGTIKIWNIDKCSCLMTLTNTISDSDYEYWTVIDMKIINDKLIFVDIFNSSITILDLKSDKIIDTFYKNKAIINDMVIYKDKLITASLDSYQIKIWKKYEGKYICEQTIQHNKPIKTIKIHEDKIFAIDCMPISHNPPCSINLWDFNSGKFIKKLSEYGDIKKIKFF